MTTNDHEQDAAPLSPEEERVLAEELEAALAMYGGIAPPDLVELMRKIGTEAGRTHPLARRLLTAAAARPVPQQSADLPKGATIDAKDKSRGEGR